MALYAVSFEIKYDEGYEHRYETMMTAIHGSSTLYWEETTSFVLLQSDAKNPEELANRVVLGSDFSERLDKMLIIQLGVKAYAYRGTQSDKDLGRLMALR